LTHNWLSGKRLRRQALLLALALWGGYVATMATPGMRDRFGHLKGADFLHAYVLGTVALEHRGEALYDAQAQREIGEQRVPGSEGDYFLPVYGPQYSLIWAPLALLPYRWAAATWMFLSAVIYALCCYAIWRTCPNLRAEGWAVALGAAAFPGFFALITFGQNSALALAAFTGAYFALQSRRYVAAGLCFGLLAYKPQLGLAAAVVFLAAMILPRRERGDAGGDLGSDQVSSDQVSPNRSKASERAEAVKVIFGAVISVAAQFAAAWAWYGSRPIIIYWYVLKVYWYVLKAIGPSAKILEPRPYLMHSLRAFWNLLLPWPDAALALYVVTSLGILGIAVACWRKQRWGKKAALELEPRFAILLLATVLVAPHLSVYDLLILAPAVLWIADWLQMHAAPGIAWLLYLTYLLPFAGPLAAWTHVQLSVICITTLTIGFGFEVLGRQDYSPG
jgi:hypothetical protein